jgi:hypothetical protein
VSQENIFIYFLDYILEADNNRYTRIDAGLFFKNCQIKHSNSRYERWAWEDGVSEKYFS